MIEVGDIMVTQRSGYIAIIVGVKPGSKNPYMFKRDAGLGVWQGSAKTFALNIGQTDVKSFLRECNRRESARLSKIKDLPEIIEGHTPGEMILVNHRNGKPVPAIFIGYNKKRSGQEEIIYRYSNGIHKVGIDRVAGWEEETTNDIMEVTEDVH